jgi:hypothetical protein
LQSRENAAGRRRLHRTDLARTQGIGLSPADRDANLRTTLPDRPPYSRFGRLPGLYRIGERKLPDPHEEPQALTVYLPGRLLDVAEALAARHGAASIQDYCEGLLRMAIEEQAAAAKAEAVHVTQGTLQSLDDLASDPEYLAEWTASARETQPDIGLKITSDPDPSADGTSFARAAVFRHAGIDDDDPSAFLPTLRRCERITPEVADELIGSLRDLEQRLRGVERLDRRLAYALHRLAFEGQILLTDAPTEAAADAGTVDRVRLVQEAVDRVLSGEDIRYFPQENSPSAGAS